MRKARGEEQAKQEEKEEIQKPAMEDGSRDRRSSKVYKGG